MGRPLVCGAAALVALALSAAHPATSRTPSVAAQRPIGLTAELAIHGAASPAGDPGALIDRYCTRCHNDRQVAGDLSLDGVDVARPAAAPEWTPLDIVEGGIHVGMNILSSPRTAEAIRAVMRRAGVEPVSAIDASPAPPGSAPR